MSHLPAATALAALVLCGPQVALAAPNGVGDQSTRVPTLTGAAFSGWQTLPSARDLLRAAPREAMKRGISGTTILFCSVDAQGGLFDCLVDREENPGNGFGEAALSLTGKFRLKPTKSDGTSVAGETVKFPIRFVAPED